MTLARGGRGRLARLTAARAVVAAACLSLAGVSSAAQAAPLRVAASLHRGAIPLVFVQAGAVRVYDPADGHIGTVATKAAGDVAVSPDAKQTAYIAGDGSLHVVGIGGKGDRRVAQGPLGSPRWRSQSELAATRSIGGTAVNVVAFAVATGRERAVARAVSSQVFSFRGRDLVSRPAPGCATSDLYLGTKQLAKTPLDSEFALDTNEDAGIVAVVRTQASSFQCAPASAPVPTALRVFDASGKSRVVVSLGKAPGNRPADAAFSPAGTELAYVTAKGDLAVRSFLTGKDRIVAHGSVSALDW